MRSTRLAFALAITAIAVSACSVSPLSGEPRVRTPVPSGFVNGGACPEPAVRDLPDGSGCASTAGDLTVYALVDDQRKPISWHLRLQSPTGPIDQRLEAGNAFSYPRAVGAVDVQRDGITEWLIKTFDLTGHGAAWQQLNLFVLTGEELREVTLEGQPFPIRVGGISRMGEGAACRNGRLTLLRVEADNRTNTHWSFSERVFAVDGAKAHFVGRHAGHLRLAGYNDPKLDPYYAVDCHGSTYP